ncbi:NAD(P)-binding protein [Hypomontagnella monticulosa]|nr:NAD(P)-binding protein [Hypomontagnella monticulosa]
METPASKPYNLPADAVWFITGCSSGIGLALAQHIAKTPSQRLVATARNPASLSSIPDSPRVLKVALDVTSVDSLDAAFDAALTRFKRVDIVVNNAGYNIMGDTEATPRGNADARKLLDTNFWGAVDATKRALTIFREENPKSGQQGGVILNVSSMGGFLGSPGSAYYHASKFAMEGFAESVAKELDPAWGIHVCNLQPGGVKTRYVDTSLDTVFRHPAYESDPKGPLNGMLAFLKNTELHAGFATPEEVAAVIYRLVGSGKRLPMRIPLGADAFTMMLAEVESVKEGLLEWKDMSCSLGDPNMEDVAKAMGK